MLEAEKGQTVRALDVFVLGPFLLYGAFDKRIPLYFRIGLVIAGYYTIVYNARNYVANDPSSPLINAAASLPLVP